jgi:hypothetical protein
MLMIRRDRSSPDYFDLLVHQQMYLQAMEFGLKKAARSHVETRDVQARVEHSGNVALRPGNRQGKARR